jgi:hypothetical protein
MGQDMTESDRAVANTTKLFTTRSRRSQRLILNGSPFWPLYYCNDVLLILRGLPRHLNFKQELREETEISVAFLTSV